jgi:hypothetical protein
MAPPGHSFFRTPSQSGRSASPACTWPLASSSSIAALMQTSSKRSSSAARVAASTSRISFGVVVARRVSALIRAACLTRARWHGAGGVVRDKYYSRPGRRRQRGWGPPGPGLRPRRRLVLLLPLLLAQLVHVFPYLAGLMKLEQNRRSGCGSRHFFFQGRFHDSLNYKRTKPKRTEAAWRPHTCLRAWKELGRRKKRSTPLFSGSLSLSLRLSLRLSIFPAMAASLCTFLANGAGRGIGMRFAASLSACVRRRRDRERER